jgi:hypothetical protein
MTEHKRYPKRLNIYVTAEMQRKLEQVRDQRGPQASIPDMVREAIRLHLDDQEQVIGSRRHFQKTLRDEIDQAKTEILEQLQVAQGDSNWNHLFSLVVISHSLAPLFARVTGQPTTFDTLLRQAMPPAMQHWVRVCDMVQHVREHSAPLEEKESV